MPASITITGDKQIISKMDRWKTEIPRSTQQALHNAATSVVTVAKQNAPYLTGYLRSQIAIESESSTAVTIVSGAEYSIYQKVDFMGIAMQSAQANLLRELQSAINRAMK